MDKQRIREVLATALQGLTFHGPLRGKQAQAVRKLQKDMANEAMQRQRATLHKVQFSMGGDDILVEIEIDEHGAYVVQGVMQQLSTNQIKQALALLHDMENAIT